MNSRSYYCNHVVNTFTVVVVVLLLALVIRLIPVVVANSDNGVTPTLSSHQQSLSNYQKLRRSLQQQTIVVAPIDRIEVMDAVTDKKIIDLVPSFSSSNTTTVIVLSQYNLTSATQLNYVAIPVPITSSTNSTNATKYTPIKSVHFALDGIDSNFRIENAAPYAACGNAGFNYSLCPSSMKIDRLYSMTVTPWSNTSATGIAGKSYNCKFLIVQLVAPTKMPMKPTTAPIIRRPTISPTTRRPTIAPIKAPTTTAPKTIAPIQKQPTLKPIMTNSPVKAPITTAPMLKQPTSTTPIMIPRPTISPTKAPALPTNITSNNCTIPKFLDNDWSWYRKYPLGAAESHGTTYGNDFAIFSGFSISFNNVTNRCFVLDLRTLPTGNWTEIDPFPLQPGISHSAHISVGNTTYFCGGYVGGVPGPATEKCFVYNHNAPLGSRFTVFPSLPSPRGAALFYHSSTNALIFATGASRPKAWITIDHNDTWEILLSNTSAGWIYKGATPFHSNHIGKVTVKYNPGTTTGVLVDRHYMLGGQIEENEGDGNIDDMYEMIPSSAGVGTNTSTNHTWIRRQSMMFPRGHFSESSIAYKNCGFLIIAGAINNGITVPGLARTNDISYYDIQSDTWTSIGNLSAFLATPVCVMNGEYIYCQTGYVNSAFSVRRRIS